MTRIWLLLPLAVTVLIPLRLASPLPACCPTPPSGKPVVNADQTVIIVWDAATKTEHFIRQASFKSEADDFGFLVPTPNQPELNESGNAAFPFLQKLTEPEVEKMPKPTAIACGCGAARDLSAGDAAPLAKVQVLQEKLVAGFQAAVLQADSANALVLWLKDNGYAFSPAVEAWAKPYVEAGWKITALKVAKSRDGKDDKTVAASALRMTFKTDRPLFPYREPDSKGAATALGVNHRLLRIYFVAEARYQGELTRDVTWTGGVAWANKLNAEDRKTALGLLNLPETTGPAEWWLTEFEDSWPYRVAPADVYFSRDSDQNTIKRPPIIQYVSSAWPTDVMAYAIAAVVIVPPLLRKRRRTSRR
jgi:Uncharacterized protein conserved in bacteria (DUF2330)